MSNTTLRFLSSVEHCHTHFNLNFLPTKKNIFPIQSNYFLPSRPPKKRRRKKQQMLNPPKRENICLPPPKRKEKQIHPTPANGYPPLPLSKSSPCSFCTRRWAYSALRYFFSFCSPVLLVFTDTDIYTNTRRKYRYRYEFWVSVSV